MCWFVCSFVYFFFFREFFFIFVLCWCCWIRSLVLSNMCECGQKHAIFSSNLIQNDNFMFMLNSILSLYIISNRYVLGAFIPSRFLSPSLSIFRTARSPANTLNHSKGHKTLPNCKQFSLVPILCVYANKSIYFLCHAYFKQFSIAFDANKNVWTELKRFLCDG